MPLKHYGTHNESMTDKNAIPTSHYVLSSDMPTPMVPTSTGFDLADFYRRLTYSYSARAHLADLGSAVRLPKKGQTESGFMFWSVVINPEEDSLIVWDSTGRTVQCRHLESLALNWEIANIRQSDCLNVAADKGHVYMTDYSDSPVVSNYFMQAVTGSSHQTVDKFFVVADSRTGSIILNTTLSEKEGLQVSVVANGVNNDVFVGTKKGIARIYV